MLEFSVRRALSRPAQDPPRGVSPGAVTLIGASLRAAVRVHTGFHSVTPTGSPSSLGHLPGPEGQQAVASP